MRAHMTSVFGGVNSARWVAVQAHFSVGADEIRERPECYSVRFGVTAVRVSEHGMFEIPGIHHAAYNFQWSPDTLINFDDHMGSPLASIMMLPCFRSR